MVVNDQSFEFELIPQSLIEIEHFVDLICDQLFINETYYGNILMSVTEFFNLLILHQQKGTLIITYSTDYQEVNIKIQPVDPEVVKRIEQEIEVENIPDDQEDKGFYLLSKLTDEIEISDKDAISLIFDISALHNEVYEHRKNMLQNFFTAEEKKKVKKKDDQL